MLRVQNSIYRWISYGVLLCSLTACDGAASRQAKAAAPMSEVEEVHDEDEIEAFFKSKGVVRFKASDANTHKNFELLNADRSVFASINLAEDLIILQGKSYKLSAFNNQEAVKRSTNFFPKDFYPDHSVFHFEYLDIKDGLAEVLLDKKNGIKKYIDVKNGLFGVESWRQHLTGSMFSFDEQKNVIRDKPAADAKSLGYESSGKDYFFLVAEIQGDWIRIGCAELCGFGCDLGKQYDGWIRWKEGDKLLITLAYAC